VGGSIRADKLHFDAYRSQVEGESAKVQLVQYQAQAYSAYVQGKAAISDVALKNQAAQLQRQELRLRAFVANTQADVAYLQAQVAAITANAQVHQTNTQRYSAEAGARAELAKVQVAAWQAQAQVVTAQWEAQMRKVVADMEQMVRTAALQADGFKAVAQVLSTLAAGQSAGVTAGASVGADARVSASGSNTINQSV